MTPFGVYITLCGQFMRRFALIASWLALLLGLCAFVALGLGYYQSLSLPNVPRPTIGPGFSESATALFGGALLGWWISGFGVVCALASILVGERTRFKVLAAIPTAIYFVAPLFFVTIPEILRTHFR